MIEALESRHPRLLLEQGMGEEFAERMADALTVFAAGFAPRPIDLLVRAGIDAISVNIDMVDRTRRLIDAAERRVLLDAARGRTVR